jgi:hypothetical protein
MEELDQVCGSFFLFIAVSDPVWSIFWGLDQVLVGGLEQLLFFHILGIIIPID